MECGHQLERELPASGRTAGADLRHAGRVRQQPRERVGESPRRARERHARAVRQQPRYEASGRSYRDGAVGPRLGDRLGPALLRPRHHDHVRAGEPLARLLEADRSGERHPIAEPQPLRQVPQTLGLRTVPDELQAPGEVGPGAEQPGEPAKHEVEALLGVQAPDREQPPRRAPVTALPGPGSPRKLVARHESRDERDQV